LSVQDFVVDGVTCSSCKTTLVRVPQTVYPIAEIAPADAIICLDCGALDLGLGRGGGLVGGVLTKDTREKIVEALRHATP
jgi:hypothetical protein